MSVFKEMDKIVRDFMDELDTMLDHDDGIEVNSTEELVKKANKYLEEQK